MLGDKAYDSAELREDLGERGTKPVIPNRCNRKQPFSFSKRLYKLRWRIESAFNRLKGFRRIATRYDRLARNYLASVCLAAALYGGFNEFEWNNVPNSPALAGPMDSGYILAPPGAALDRRMRDYGKYERIEAC